MLRLSSSEFCNYLRHFQDAYDILDTIESALGCVVIDNRFGSVLDDHLAILGEACLEDDNHSEETIQNICGWLFWFCYDNDFGKNKYAILEGNEGFCITSIEDMYNYLNNNF